MRRAGAVGGDSPRASAGLTLVEVVVALAVLSLVVLALGATLRGLSQSAQRVDERVDAIDELRVGSAFLRELLARATPAWRAGPERRLLLDAAPDHLAFVAVMPPRFGAAGRFAFRIAAEPQADGTRALVLRYAPWRADAVDFPDWSGTDSRVLAARVERLALVYGGDGVAGGWQANWPTTERLPPRVRLDLDTHGGPWPPLLLPVRTPPGNSATFTIGGSGR